MNVSSPRPKKLYVCKWCNKPYKSKNGLGYHTKKCRRTSASSPPPPQFVLDETLIPSLPTTPFPLPSPSSSPVQNILCDVVESTQEEALAETQHLEDIPEPQETFSKEIIQFFYDSSKNSQELDALSPIPRIRTVKPTKPLFLPERDPSPVGNFSPVIFTELQTSEYRGFLFVMAVIWVVNTVFLIVMTVQTWYEM